MSTLVYQATDKKGRYKRKKHDILHKGDIVLLKEPLTKRHNFPMGIVKEVTINQLGECTDALVYKSSTKELVKRHSSTIIPLLTDEFGSDFNSDLNKNNSSDDETLQQRIPRKAALIAKNKIKQTFN